MKVTLCDFCERDITDEIVFVGTSQIKAVKPNVRHGVYQRQVEKWEACQDCVPIDYLKCLPTQALTLDTDDGMVKS